MYSVCTQYSTGHIIRRCVVGLTLSRLLAKPWRCCCFFYPSDRQEGLICSQSYVHRHRMPILLLTATAPCFLFCAHLRHDSKMRFDQKLGSSGQFDGSGVSRVKSRKFGSIYRFRRIHVPRAVLGEPRTTVHTRLLANYGLRGTRFADPRPVTCNR